jgi:hypothetical protein
MRSSTWQCYIWHCSFQTTVSDQCTPQPPVLVKNIMDKLTYLLSVCAKVGLFCFFTSNPEFYIYSSIVIYNDNIQNIWFYLCLHYNFSAFSHIFCAYKTINDLFLLNISQCLQNTSTLYFDHQASWELTQVLQAEMCCGCTDDVTHAQKGYSTYHINLSK